MSIASCPLLTPLAVLIMFFMTCGLVSFFAWQKSSSDSQIELGSILAQGDEESPVLSTRKPKGSLRPRTHVPLPPPPPPPLLLPFLGAGNPAVCMEHIRNSLSFANIVPDDAGNIALNEVQRNILFVDDDEIPHVGSANVSLLQIAGQVALWKNSSNNFMKQLEIDLFPKLQAMAAPCYNMKARQYHEAKLVRLLGQNVILKVSKVEICGIFEGCTKICGSRSQIYKVQVRGQEPYEAEVDIDLICSGVVVMRAAEKVDPPVYPVAGP